MAVIVPVAAAAAKGPGSGCSTGPCECAGGHQLPQRGRGQHLGLVAIAQDPPGNLLQAGDGGVEIDRAVAVPHHPLRLVPGHFGHVVGHQGRETDHHLMVGPRLGDHPPGVAEMAFDGEAARDAVAVFEQFHATECGRD